MNSPPIAHFRFPNVVLRKEKSKKEKWQCSQNLEFRPVITFICCNHYRHYEIATVGNEVDFGFALRTDHNGRVREILLTNVQLQKFLNIMKFNCFYFI